MSAVKVWSISFLADNPEGTYVTNDVVDIYFDVSLDPLHVAAGTNGLSVKLNGADITSGSNINAFSDVNSSGVVYKRLATYNYQICNGEYSWAFSPLKSEFPYGFNIYLQGFGCQINPSTCNLVFSPNIILVYPSSQTSADGSINVLATSSNPIKYSIGNDFDYNDGTGLSTGVFTGLNAGNYRIYARDSNNCGANILIVLPYNNTYGVKYTINYINLAGHRTKIDITQRSYVGSSTDIKCDGSPLVMRLRGESILDKFQPLLATQATINLISEIDGQYREMFTNDPKQFKINIYKDVSGGTSYSLIWTGFIVPQIYNEQYVIAPYTVSLQASDNIPNLSKIAFLLDDGNKYFGSVRAMTLIANALQKTNLQLNIRSGINIFASTMMSTSSDDPLDQSYIDVDSYYIGFSGTPTWADVLNSILKAFRARLVHANGVWNILRPEECVSSFAYREYTSSGAYSSNNSYNLVSQLGAAAASNRLRWSDEDQNMEIRPGYGKLRIKYHLGYKDNILRNGDFSLITSYNTLISNYQYKINLFGFQVISSSYAMGYDYSMNTSGDLNDVSLVLSALRSQMAKPFGYIQSDTYSIAMGINNSLLIKLNIKCQSAVGVGLAVDGNGDLVAYTTSGGRSYYQKVRMTVYYGGKYLQTDGTWTNIPSDVIFYVTQFDQFVEMQIAAKWPDPTYNTPKDFYIRVYHSSDYDYDYEDATSLKRKMTNSNVATFNNRGAWDASTGLLPSTGGSGGGGAILAGDRWTVTIPGIIQGTYCAVGVNLRAINGGPGQALANWLIGEIVLPQGTKTEVHNSSAYLGLGIYYYELENNTSAESIPNIVRPNDYNSSTNPFQWVLKSSNFSLSQRPSVDFFINKIQVQYLDNGNTPFDTIIKDIQGESNNLLAVEDDIYHGSVESYFNSIVTSALVSNLRDPNATFDLTLSGQFPNNRTIFPNLVSVPITQNILSGDLIYTGYFRDSSGIGFTDWARNGISESEHLYNIWLKTTIAQYNRSWRKITGSLYGDIFISAIAIIKDFDGIKYLPMSLDYDDKNNSYNGEFLELMDIFASVGSDGTSTSPFSNGFDLGHGG